jgi:hypothetical protein
VFSYPFVVRVLVLRNKIRTTKLHELSRNEIPREPIKKLDLCYAENPQRETLKSGNDATQLTTGCSQTEL